MKKIFYKIFKSNVYNRYNTILDKQNKRIEILTEIRGEMIIWNKFYFSMPISKRTQYQKRMNLQDNDETTRLFIRLAAPKYNNLEHLKVFAKEFPLDNLDVNINKPYFSTW